MFEWGRCLDVFFAIDSKQEILVRICEHGEGSYEVFFNGKYRKYFSKFRLNYISHVDDFM